MLSLDRQIEQTEQEMIDRYHVVRPTGPWVCTECGDTCEVTDYQHTYRDEVLCDGCFESAVDAEISNVRALW